MVHWWVLVQLWHMVCTILEVPIVSFFSTFNHDHLPSCSLFWHKCKESNGLILHWLRFASKSLLQVFIKVSSLVGLVAELILPSISSHMCIGFRGSMQQQEIHHPIATCKSSHISSCLLCET